MRKCLVLIILTNIAILIQLVILEGVIDYAALFSFSLNIKMIMMEFLPGSIPNKGAVISLV